MHLREYIEKIGDEKAAALFGVTVRAAQSWRRGERFPRKKQADVIVATSPVTYAGIYGGDRKASA